MIKISKMHHNKPDLTFSSSWIYLEDKNGMPVDGKFIFEKNNLICSTNEKSVRLNILHKIDGFGEIIVKTSVLSHKKNSYNLEEIIAKGRIDQIKKEFRNCENSNKEKIIAKYKDKVKNIEKCFVKAKKCFISKKNLAELFFVGESITLALAKANLKIRIQKGNKLALNGQGFRINSNKKYNRCFLNLFDEATIPVYFTKIFAKGKSPDWKELDNIINFFWKKNIPMQVNHLVWLHQYNLPDWMKKISFYKMRKIIFLFIDEFCQRYGNKIANWSILNEIPDSDANFFNLTVDELIQFANDISLKLKTLIPDAKTYINLSKPTGAKSSI